MHIRHQKLRVYRYNGQFCIPDMISGSSTETSRVYRNMPKFLLLQNIPDGVSFGLNTINHATLLSLSSVLPLSRPLASPSSYRMLLFFLSLQTLQRTPKRQNNDNCRHGSHSNCSVMRSKGNELPPTSGSALGYQRAMDFSS